ncbi:MAG: DNA-binding response regulator [Verrucomicrobia bacterium]|nr:MAG: DNA-binding response regulator [Verrucomicrobiota bacterium]
MNHPKIRILLVDDHAMIRLGLAGVLSAEPGMEICGQARNGREAIEQHAALQPDITLMDGMLPDMHGVDAINEILQHSPAAKVILISINETAEDVRRAMKAGVMGYVPKSCDLPDYLAQRLAEQSAMLTLSQREVEVLRLVAQGKANKEIASILTLSNETVKTHLAHILRKLGAADRAHAVTIAMEEGFLRN